MNELNAKKNTRHHSEDARQMWIKAVEQMAENQQLKERIEFLERSLARDVFAGWTVH